MSNDIQLDSEFELNKNITIKNRFFKSAMSEQLGDDQHNPGNGLVRLYETWARGGTGLLVTGNVMVDRLALGEPKNVVLDRQSDLSLFKRWSQAAQKNGAKVWMQLNHPGKQIPKFLCKEPVAPSAISLGAGLESTFNTPRALDTEEIRSIVKQFATAANLAKECGFDGVQIHGAHGYLVSQFLSPRHNRRTDEWGGSLENRMRFVLEIYHAIKAEVGEEFPVGIKLNSADYMKGGFDDNDAMKVVKSLSEAGIDLIEISGGTYESPSMVGYKVKASTQKREAYFLEFAEKIRDLVKTPLVVTGGFRSGAAMLNALNSGATDMIGLARPLAVQPDMPNRLIADKNHQVVIKDPTTGLKFVDNMVMLNITWYESQLARMAKGKPAVPDQSAWVSVLQTLGGLGMHAFKQRRA